MKDFYEDKDKMQDLYDLSKAEFLKSYSYITEEEYDLTMDKFIELDCKSCHNCMHVLDLEEETCHNCLAKQE